MSSHNKKKYHPKELQTSWYTLITLAQTKQCNMSVFLIYLLSQKNANLNHQIKLIILIMASIIPN
jgi:hypothetical protein